MATRKQKETYLNKMARDRGYVLEYHKVLVNHDFRALQKINEFLDAVYLSRRRLDRRTKELISIVGLILGRASKGQICSHMKVAMDLGVTKAELLEAVELTLPMSGFVVFQAGLEAWCAIAKAKTIQPTVNAYTFGRGDDQPA